MPNRPFDVTARRLCVLVVMLAAALTCGACASTATRLGQTGRGAPLASPLVAGTRSNRALTARETDRLLELARVPNSEQPISKAPKVLSGSAAGVPASGSLVDNSRLWRVPMSFARAVAWVTAHPPVGLTEFTTSNGTDHGVATTSGFAYTDHASAAWHDAELEIGVAPDGPHATYWRADGLALWLDNRPQPDAAGGRRLAFTVNSGCPRSDDGQLDAPPSGVTDALVPSATATAGLICRYNGLNRGTFALNSQSRLSATQASHLAALARRVQLSHTNGDEISCPADFAPGLAALTGALG